jgi:uncharacterized protein YciI
MAFIVTALALAALAQQKERRPPPGLRCPQRTLVLFNVDWNAFKPDMFSEHSAYLLTQMKAGKIVSAGALDVALTPPASNKVPNGAAVIYTSMNWSEVEEIIKQDPYYRAGVATIASHNVWNACEAEK